MKEKSLYDLRGVSASKEDVHRAIRHLDKGLYPDAFCKILPDIAGGDGLYCNIMHADTAGTKPSLAYLYWKETGDMEVWDGIVQDAIVMNTDDMACVGCADNIVISSTVGRNKQLIPGEVIERIIQATQRFIDQMAEHGITLVLAGGETADVGDIIRTVDIGITSFARMKRKNLVINRIEEGDVIVGLSSFGKANYESQYNGGMGSNGLTSARHDLLHHQYADKYPESFDPKLDRKYVYSGSGSLTDALPVEGYGKIPLGKLILSPTRTYLPIVQKLLQENLTVHGMIHCTGGAQTKVLKFIDKKKVIKNNLFKMPPLFKLIERETQTTREEMYRVFNMGHRMEIYTSEQFASSIISIADYFGIEAKIIGFVENSNTNQVLIMDEKGSYIYE